MSAKIIIVEIDAGKPQPGAGGHLAYRWTLVHGDNVHIESEGEYRTAEIAAEQACRKLAEVSAIAADQRRKEQAAKH